MPKRCVPGWWKRELSMLWHQRTWTRCHLEPIFLFVNSNPRRMGNKHSLKLSFNMMNWIFFQNNGGVRHINPEVHFLTLTEKYIFYQVRTWMHIGLPLYVTLKKWAHELDMSPTAQTQLRVIQVQGQIRSVAITCQSWQSLLLFLGVHYIKHGKSLKDMPESYTVFC